MGMSPMKTMICVVLPQAFKNIIPEMANTFLTNLKMTSVLKTDSFFASRRQASSTRLMKGVCTEWSTTPMRVGWDARDRAMPARFGV